MSTLGTYLFVLIRKIIFPFSQIVPFVSKKGDVLDVGCGHGTLIKLLAEQSGTRKIVGIDPSKDKIRRAEKLVSYPNVEFYATTLEKLHLQKYNTIIIIDVLYLMPYEQKLDLLKEANKRLAKDGVLLLKEIVRENSLMYYIILFEEFLMMKVLKLTFSNSKKSEVLTEKEHKELLIKAGFTPLKTKKIRTILPYPHTLFVSKVTQNRKA